MNGISVLESMSTYVLGYLGHSPIDEVYKIIVDVNYRYTTIRLEDPFINECNKFLFIPKISINESGIFRYKKDNQLYIKQLNTNKPTDLSIRQVIEIIKVLESIPALEEYAISLINMVKEEKTFHRYFKMPPDEISKMEFNTYDDIKQLYTKIRETEGLMLENPPESYRLIPSETSNLINFYLYDLSSKYAYYIEIKTNHNCSDVDTEFQIGGNKFIAMSDKSSLYKLRIESIDITDLNTKNKTVVKNEIKERVITEKDQYFFEQEVSKKEDVGENRISSVKKPIYILVFIFLLLLLSISIYYSVFAAVEKTDDLDLFI